MQFLRNLVEKQKTLYHAKDSKFHKVWPLFDAFETFLFAPDHRSGTSRVHVRDYVDLKRVMNNVILAMVPCLLWAIWNAGVQHFHGWQMVADAAAKAGKPAPEYVLGWLQSLLGAPNLAALTPFDNIVFGLQRMLPILVVSGYLDGRLTHRDLVDAGLEILAKPIDRQRLAAALTRALQGSPRVATPPAAP